MFGKQCVELVFYIASLLDCSPQYIVGGRWRAAAAAAARGMRRQHYVRLYTALSSSGPSQSLHVYYRVIALLRDSTSQLSLWSDAAIYERPCFKITCFILVVGWLLQTSCNLLRPRNQQYQQSWIPPTNNIVSRSHHSSSLSAWVVFIAFVFDAIARSREYVQHACVHCVCGLCTSARHRALVDTLTVSRGKSEISVCAA